jgi:hypothetical protein
MAKIVLHFAIELTDDGRVLIQRSGWNIVRDRTAKGPLGTDEIAAIAAAFSEPRPASRDGPDVPLDAHQVQGTPALSPHDMSAGQISQVIREPAPIFKPNALDKKHLEQALVAMGFTEPVAEGLLKLHTPERCQSVIEWVNRKAAAESVLHPAALALSLFSKTP